MLKKKAGYFVGALIFLGSFVSCSRPLLLPQQIGAADSLIKNALQDSLFAGAVFLVGSSSEVLHQKAFGYAEKVDENLIAIEEPVEMTTGHLFDVASLTKVLATTYAMMILHDRGLLDVDDPVFRYIPQFLNGNTVKSDITIRHLLTHTSGIIPWYPTWYVADNAKERLQFTVERPLQSVPGEHRIYSDLGFMLLADIVENVSGQPFPDFLKENVYDPLELTSTGFTPDTELTSNTVATSHGNPFERRMVYDDQFGYTIDDIDPDSWHGWREYTLKGEVNDGNAFYTHRGIAGHAGLFSTAGDIYRLVAVLLNHGRWKDQELIKPETAELFLTQNQFKQGLGWSFDPDVIHADSLPEGSFGHTGFTGTNIVVSPTNDLLYILLTNRQHFGVDENGQYPDLQKLRSAISSHLF